MDAHLPICLLPLTWRFTLPLQEGMGQMRDKKKVSTYFSEAGVKLHGRPTPYSDIKALRISYWTILLPGLAVALCIGTVLFPYGPPFLHHVIETLLFLNAFYVLFAFLVSETRVIVIKRRSTPAIYAFMNKGDAVFLANQWKFWALFYTGVQPSD